MCALLFGVFKVVGHLGCLLRRLSLKIFLKKRLEHFDLLAAMAATLTCAKKGTTDSTANRNIQSSCEEPPVGKSSCDQKHQTSHVEQKNRDPKLTASHRGCGCSWKGSQLRWPRHHSTSPRVHFHLSLKYVRKGAGASERLLAFTFCSIPWQHKSRKAWQKTR